MKQELQTDWKPLTESPQGHCWLACITPDYKLIVGWQGISNSTGQPLAPIRDGHKPYAWCTSGDSEGQPPEAPNFLGVLPNGSTVTTYGLRDGGK